jgi:hypothetical protein
MHLHLIYTDFLRFLDALEEEDVWDAYRYYYYNPHQRFLDSYWRTFRWMGPEQVRSRVERIKTNDYSLLRSLVESINLDVTVKNILDRCVRVIEAPEEPDIYFMVGFFSADGFVLEHEGRPVIGFGLERFKSWHLLPILFAHEYAHFLRHLARSDEPYCDVRGETVPRFLLSEGIAIAFSEAAFSEYPLRDHLLFSEERLRWCQSNESRLLLLFRQVLEGKCDSEVLWKGTVQLGIPPRTGNYIGHLLVKRYCEQRRRLEFEHLITFKDILNVVEELGFPVVND